MSDASNAATKADLEVLGMRMLGRLEKSETTLLKEFRKWAISFESKFRASDALVTGFSERVASLEERVSELEHRDRPRQPTRSGSAQCLPT